MRLRHIRDAEERIAGSPYVVQVPQKEKGIWAERFGKNDPIEIEVGMGKGRFIMELARTHPDKNYIGIERYSSVLLRALEKREQEGSSNIWFLCIDAGEMGDIFEKGEVSKIYLNFSDPWPKDRHAKRRLTSPRFMAVYEQILAADGSVEFKTDDQELFRYSLESIAASGWRILRHTFDLYSSDMMEGNVKTEYEAKFTAEGKKICKLIAVQKTFKAYGSGETFIQ